MADPNEVMANARKLLREGRTQEADDLITAHFAAEASAGRELSETALEPAKPREPRAVITDILTELIGLAGNKDSLLRLLTELNAVQ